MYSNLMFKNIHFFSFINYTVTADQMFQHVDKKPHFCLWLQSVTIIPVLHFAFNNLDL